MRLILAATMLLGIVTGHSVLYRELILFAVAGPIFGYSCAELAKVWGRRPWVWFLLGCFFTFTAVLALILLRLVARKPISAPTPHQ
jgi:hypothetical protein